MCGNNNTFVRKSGSNLEAPGSKCHFQRSTLLQTWRERRERNHVPCSRDPKTINKQIIEQPALFTPAESLSSEMSLPTPRIHSPSPLTNVSLTRNRLKNPKLFFPVTL